MLDLRRLLHTRVSLVCVARRAHKKYWLVYNLAYQINTIETKPTKGHTLNVRVLKVARRSLLCLDFSNGEQNNKNAQHLRGLYCVGN